MGGVSGQIPEEQMGNGKVGNGAQKLDKEAQRPEVWTERMGKDLKSGHRGLHLEQGNCD